MHAEAVGLARVEIVRQIRERKIAIIDYAAHVPIGHAVEKLRTWQHQGAQIVYLTSRTKPDQVAAIQNVLKRHGFPEGELFYRRSGEAYADVAERVMPDVLIEDDCASIGGESEMTYPHLKPTVQARIQSITVPEFGGIDHLTNHLAELFQLGQKGNRYASH